MLPTSMLWCVSGTAAATSFSTSSASIVCGWAPRLGTQEDTRQRFLRALPTGDPQQASLAFAIDVNEKLAGYSLLNRYTPEVNYSHWHIINPGLRASGLSSALYPYRIRTYFDVAQMNRLTHQTRTRNTAVNRMLDKYVPVAETRYIENPDGVALPGEFHLRHVRREDIPGFFARAGVAVNIE